MQSNLQPRALGALARTAIDVQDAVNLSGVGHSFRRALEYISQASNELGKGTAWKNNHPIAVMFASKIHCLAGGDGSIPKFSEAYAWCCQVSERSDSEATSWRDFQYEEEQRSTAGGP